MKKTDITTILLNIILLTYFIYFNVVYVFPIFQKKTERFENDEDDLDIIEKKNRYT